MPTSRLVCSECRTFFEVRSGREDEPFACPFCVEEAVFPLTPGQYAAACDALGGEVALEEVGAALSKYAGEDNAALARLLADRERDFGEGGGRGVKLADEIDALRIALAVRRAPD